MGGCSSLSHCESAVIPVQLPNTHHSQVYSPVVIKGPTKIQITVAAIDDFLHKLMNRGDRCSVVAFNNNYKILSLLGNKSNAINGLVSCLQRCNGGTQLWTATIMSVAQFIATADRSRPWILIVLTDGDDSGGGAGVSDVATALTGFNTPTDNFTFFIGLGHDAGEKSLRSLCESSNSLYFGAKDEDELKLTFAIMAIKIAQGIQMELEQVRAHGIEATYARIEEMSSVYRQPIDMFILVDISGSMNEAA